MYAIQLGYFCGDKSPLVELRQRKHNVSTECIVSSTAAINEISTSIRHRETTKGFLMNINIIGLAFHRERLDETLKHQIITLVRVGYTAMQYAHQMYAIINGSVFVEANVVVVCCCSTNT